MGAKSIFAFFPYLRTREQCRIRGLEFRRSDDLDGVGKEEADHVEILSRMFNVAQGGRIVAPTFALLTGDTESDIELSLTSLREAQLLAGFLYGVPHRLPTVTDNLFLQSECWSCYTFTPTDMVPPSLVMTTAEDSSRVLCEGDMAPTPGDFLPGYHGLRDGVVSLSLIEGSRIYPEVQHVCLNYSQDLSADVKHFLSDKANWPFEPLFRGLKLSPKNHDRIFRALLWHSRSCRSSADTTERLVSLAVALETLLALEKGERVSSRFKEAVITLIGPVPRLQEWLDQFYEARSAAVHDGASEQLMFSIPGPKRISLEHRSLIVYGRRIFRVCLGAALTGIMLAKKSKLPSLLIHNDERLNEICKVLASDLPPRDRISSAADYIEELHEGETLSWGPKLEEDLEKLFGAGKLLVEAYLAGNRANVPGLDDQLNAFVASQGAPPDLIKAVEAGKKVTELLMKTVRAERKGDIHDDIVLRFFEFAARPMVAVECHRRKRVPRAK